MESEYLNFVSCFAYMVNYFLDKIWKCMKRKVFFFLFLTLYAFSAAKGASYIDPDKMPKHESRAVWLTTLSGLDWPKTKAHNETSRQKQQQELCTILDSLKKIRINTVLLQTRVRGTVIYPSALEPWDGCMSGTVGTSPGYDPLAFAIEECHKRGMELHAWMVTVPCFKTNATKALGSKSVLKKHPDLCKKHQDTWYLDPGMPGTAEYLSKLCSEVVSNYDIDGIHFDYIRYPENARSFPDHNTYRKYGKGMDKAVWRRNNITHCVERMYHTVKNIKPWVKVSSSPIGKYRDLTRFPSYGWNAFDAVYQDAQKWMQKGIHDMLFPMMYFQGNHFYPFAVDWNEDSGGQPVVPGLGIYFLSEKEKNWNLDVIERELQFIRNEHIPGQAYFRTEFLLNNVKGLYDYLRTFYYPYPALTPVCNRLDSVAPEAPKKVCINMGQYQATLSWNAANDDVNKKDVRYHVYASRSYPVDVTKAQNLVCTALRDTFFSFNPMYVGLYGYHFAVTATDRSGNESMAAYPQEAEYRNTKVVQHTSKKIMLASNGNKLILPNSHAEFFMILDMQGRVLFTVPYQKEYNIAHLPKGVYQIRTLEKKGYSHALGEFIKP